MGRQARSAFGGPAREKGLSHERYTSEGEGVMRLLDELYDWWSAPAGLVVVLAVVGYGLLWLFTR